MPGSISTDGAMPQTIAGKGGGIQMPSPGTLQRLEDPRASHARGEAGTRHSQRPAGSASGGLITLPMAPPPPKGRMVQPKKKVLEEEEYVDRLGEIIEGDYFPHNAKMQRSLVDLAGRPQGSGNGSSDPYSHPPRENSRVSTPSSFNGIPTPGGSVIESDGGREARGGGSGSRIRSPSKEAGTGGALTKFVATHTSEDNQAFAELQEKDQEAFRRRHFWAYDTTPDGEGVNATSSKLLILPNGKMMSVERREIMDAACADRPKIGDDRPNQVETWKHRTRNHLMFSPNLAASNDICRIEQDPTEAAQLLLKDGASKISTKKRKRQMITQSGEVERMVTGAEGASTGGEGTFAGQLEGTSAGQLAMGGGDASSSSDNPATKSASGEPHVKRKSAIPSEQNGSAITERAARGDPSLPPCELDSDDPSDFDSSRLPQQQEGVSSMPERGPSPPVAARGRVPVKMNPKVIQAHATRFPKPEPRKPIRGPWASPIEKPSSSRESVAELLAGTTNPSGYEEVPMTPSRVPGVDGDSPQITWGSIDGTPMILDPRATPLPGGEQDVAPGMDAASFIGALGSVGTDGHQFEIKDLPPRDQLAHRLEAADTRRKRAKLGVGLASEGRGTRTPLPATPLTGRTPGSGQRTPGTGKRSLAAKTTPGGPKGRSGGKTYDKGKNTAAMPSTPAAKTLAAKLARRQRDDTPFGGGLTPGRQKRSSRSGKGNSSKMDGLTPLPSTPARSTTPITAREKMGSSEGKRSSLTDGLLALK